MPHFTGVSITMNLQEAFQDAVRQALVTKPEVVGETVKEVQVTRIYSVREGEGSFNKIHVEIEAR